MTVSSNEVTCDEEGCFTVLQLPGGLMPVALRTPRTLLRRFARDHGWSSDAHGHDYCPRHSWA